MKNSDLEFEKIKEAIFESTGTSSPELRRAVEAKAMFHAGVGEGTDVPAELQKWVEKVARYAYKTLDSDVEELKESGFSEDDIFELTVAAAHGAARARLESAVSVVDEAEELANAS